MQGNVNIYYMSCDKICLVRICVCLFVWLVGWLFVCLFLFLFLCLFVCLFVCAKIHALYPHHCALHGTVKHTHCLAQAGLKDLAQVTV